jgi:osmotically-inducible protein OsmY
MLTPKAVRRLALTCAACAGLAGCTQQDTECLARIGRKVLDRTQGAADTVRAHLGGDHVPNPATALNEHGLKEKVETRLRWDALLTDAKIEVHVSGNEVELQGMVKNDAQRRRAGDLAETTAGVQAVNDSLKVEER